MRKFLNTTVVSAKQEQEALKLEYFIIFCNAYVQATDNDDS